MKAKACGLYAESSAARPEEDSRPRRMYLQLICLPRSLGSGSPAVNTLCHPLQPAKHFPQLVPSLLVVIESENLSTQMKTIIHVLTMQLHITNL